jgi:hypothetical protein
MVKRMLAVVWKELNPHQFQVDAITTLAFRSATNGGVAPSLCLVRKTGGGNSIVLYGMATMRRKITICIVPLVGLGSDQASKVNQMCIYSVYAAHASLPLTTSSTSIWIAKLVWQSNPKPIPIPYLLWRTVAIGIC